MKYRAEIDGLRALAVLPVILFHAGYNKYFIGGDVHFNMKGHDLIFRKLIEEDKRFK
jgi:peptidoglycan/LPS O-acetylase OafA/YrhL